MRFSLATLMLIFPLSFPVLGQANQRTLPDSPNGFDKQFKLVFKAYEKGDEKALLERFRTFAIPERWFTDEFGPEEGPKLSNQYLYRFRDFETDIVQEFNRVPCDYDVGCNQGNVATRTTGGTKFPKAPPAPASVLSLPPIQSFRIEHFSIWRTNGCLSAPSENSSCMDSPNTEMYHHNSQVSSFIYVDGAFRFVGFSTCTFWDPCAANHPIPASQLDKPPEPVRFNLYQKPQSPQRDLLDWMAKLLGKSP